MFGRLAIPDMDNAYSELKSTIGDKVNKNNMCVPVEKLLETTT